MVGVIILVAIIANLDSDDKKEVVEPIKAEVSEPKNQNIPFDLVDPSLNSGLEIKHKDLIGRWFTVDDNSGGFTFTEDFKVYVHAYNDDTKSWITTKNPGSYALHKDMLSIDLFGDKTELEVVRFNQNKIVLINWEAHNPLESFEETDFILWNRRNSPF